MTATDTKTITQSVADARNHFPELVHQAEGGAVVEITRRGKAVAVLVSKNEYTRLTQARPDVWQAIQDWRKTVDWDELGDVDEIFADVRDRSPGRDFQW